MSSVTNEPWTITVDAGSKGLDAAADVLCNLTGWPLKDCRYAAMKMFEEAAKARKASR